ncbi:MAG: DUF4390 domain-containing protein [Acidobacteriota bacterium]|nr:DUF4390 domain-containing protein [Acidobacteriota bacterium]
MRPGPHLCLVGLVVLFWVAPAWADFAEPSVTLTEARVDDRGALVSFEIHGGLPKELLERIESGTPVTFRHRLELFARRPFPIPNRVLGRTTVDTRVEYDTLGKQYVLSRTIRLRARKKRAQPPTEEHEVTDSVERMVDWMTRLDDLAIDDAGSDKFNDSRRVRVTTNLGRRYIMWIFPASLSVTAEQPLRP